MDYVKPVLYFAVILLGAFPAYARTYYTAKSGTDQNDCVQAQSPSTPRFTVRAGLQCLSSGDTLMIGRGEYNEFIDYNQVPSGNGSWATATVVRAMPGQTVTFRPAKGGGAGDVVWIMNSSYIIFDGLTIDGQNVPVQGIRIQSESKFIRVINSEIKNAPSNNCIGTAGSWIEIMNNKVHDCGSTYQHHGIYVQGSNNIIEKNEIYNLAGFGIHLYGPGSANNDNVIRYNYVHKTGIAGPDHGSGILIGSGSGNRAYGNVVMENKGIGIQIGFFNPRANQVYDNKIYSNGGDCIFIRNGSADSDVRNNVCWHNRIDEVSNYGRSSVIDGKRDQKH